MKIESGTFLIRLLVEDLVEIFSYKSTSARVIVGND